ncbi:MAG: hypothetical protein KDB27_16420 [Planctomycetales bacterium]|nr:hypothetical protein [Planctomycetales bacterium]
MLERLYSLNQDERRSACWLFFYNFCNAGAYVLVRTVADSAFLSHIGTEQLPALYMLSAGVVALSSLAYGHWMPRIGFRKLVIGTLLALSLMSVVTPIAMNAFTDSLTVYALVYLLSQVRGSLGTIFFTTLLSEQFANNRPERIVGFLGAGANVAGVLLGFATGVLAHKMDVHQLMYAVAAIDLLTIIPMLQLKPRRAITFSHADSTEKSRFRDALHTPYVLSIASLVVITVLVSTFVEYQWKVTAASEYSRNEESLAAYFGYFYGAIYLVTGLLQLFVTNRVLQSGGILVGLLLFPVSLLVSTGIAWVVAFKQAALWPLTITKACDALKRSFNEPSIQIAYSPMQHRLRRQAITFVAGIAKPFSEAIAAAALVILASTADVRDLSGVVLALVVIWLVVSVRVWRQFANRRHRAERFRTDLDGGVDPNKS